MWCGERWPHLAWFQTIPVDVSNKSQAYLKGLFVVFVDFFIFLRLGTSARIIRAKRSLHTFVPFLSFTLHSIFSRHLTNYQLLFFECDCLAHEQCFSFTYSDPFVKCKSFLKFCQNGISSFVAQRAFLPTPVFHHGEYYLIEVLSYCFLMTCFVSGISEAELNEVGGKRHIPRRISSHSIKYKFANILTLSLHWIIWI